LKKQKKTKPLCSVDPATAFVSSSFFVESSRVVVCSASLGSKSLKEKGIKQSFGKNTVVPIA
jgi:hypothetical protein